MATILTKKSDTASAVPLAADLTNAAGGAELAVNATDKRLFSKTSGGTVVELGTNPSTLVLPSGSANGVAYLNGSKVVTSGSALTFDGTDLLLASGGLLDIDSTNAAVAMRIRQTTVGAGTEFTTTITENTGVTFDSSDSAGATARSFIWTAAGSEGMRLTSTGLGIGTSSPANKLHVELSQNASTWANVTNGNNGSGAASGILLGTDQGTSGALSQNSSGNTSPAANALRLRNLLNAPIAFETNGSERMRLDSSGNLGLGVTPSAWGGNYKAIQFSSGAISSYQTNAMDLYGNAYDSGAGAWKYLHSSLGATRLASTNGQFQFYNAPVGTAGNAITFTQAATLTAGGDFLVGTTTSNGRLTVEQNSADTTISIGRTGYTATKLIGGTLGDGNGFKINVNGSDRVAIDSSGSLLVGTTTVGYGLFSGPKFTISAASDGICVGGLAQNNSAYTTQANNDTGNRYALYIANGSSNPVGNIAFTSTLTSYNTTSDYRLKNTIAPMTGALAKVSLLKPCTYKWNSNGSESEGFIAHELAEVVPHAVTGEKDAVDANGKIKPQSIDTSFLVATLTAAIQEQQAIIESLKARLDAANL